MAYRFERKGRTRRALGLVGAVWATVLLAWWMLDMAPWIVAVLLAFTLPAALDYARDKTAWLSLDDTHLRWDAGRQTGEIALARIRALRLETRLDLSLRARVVLDTADRIKLPQECTPPMAEAQAAFEDAGVTVERHPFSLL